MSFVHVFFAALVSIVLAAPQTTAAGTPLSVQAALPIVFTKTVSASHAHAGDLVLARTTQASMLPNGTAVPAGTEVRGHVAEATAFVYDKTPYAQQKESVLAIRFDAVRVASRDVPVNLTVRALADPIVSLSAQEAKSTDLDSLGNRTQIGGDQLVPSQNNVMDRNGDIVAYNRRDGVYARLIAHNGCGASAAEVSVGLYSASACGLYGFAGVTARRKDSATLSLVSTHGSPQVWQHSTALLEVMPAGSR